MWGDYPMIVNHDAARWTANTALYFFSLWSGQKLATLYVMRCKIIPLNSHVALLTAEGNLCCKYSFCEFPWQKECISSIFIHSPYLVLEKQSYKVYVQEKRNPLLDSMKKVQY